VTLPSAADWRQHFTDVPPAFYRLLGELLQEVQAEREREQGVERRGRRPALASGSMQDVADLVYPRRSSLPFAEALRAATRQTPSTIARLASMNPGTLHGLMNGSRQLNMAVLQDIARAIHVDPAYFHEYRVLAIHEAIDSLLTPERSARAYAAIEPTYNAARPEPKNAAGFTTTARPGTNTFANPAKRVEGSRA
jgi:hypothetical protein